MLENCWNFKTHHTLPLSMLCILKKYIKLILFFSRLSWNGQIPCVKIFFQVFFQKFLWKLFFLKLFFIIFFFFLFKEFIMQIPKESTTALSVTMISIIVAREIFKKMWKLVCLFFRLSLRACKIPRSVSKTVNNFFHYGLHLRPKKATHAAEMLSVECVAIFGL